MKRLLLLALIAFAAWYGWKHYAELKRGGSHDIVVSNRSGHEIDRLRVTAGDQTVVVETLADLCPVEQERILDYGSLLDPDIRKENGVADAPADDECSRCEHAVDDLGFTA